MKTLSLVLLLSLAACAEEVASPPATEPPTETTTNPTTPEQGERVVAPSFDSSKVVLKQARATDLDPHVEAVKVELQR